MRFALRGRGRQTIDAMLHDAGIDKIDELLSSHFDIHNAEPFNAVFTSQTSYELGSRSVIAKLLHTIEQTPAESNWLPLDQEVVRKLIQEHEDLCSSNDIAGNMESTIGNT